MTTTADQIQDILDNFNFEQVQKVMVFMPDEWWKGKDGGVPTVCELYTYAEKLLQRAVDFEGKEPVTISCGGFHAHRWVAHHTVTGKKGDWYELIFAVTEWDA